MMRVLMRSDLQSCFIAIFVSMFVQMGITGTLTMHLIQNYDCEASTAYYFMAVWGTGLTLGNCISSCLLKKMRKTIYASFAGLIFSLLLIGPTNAPILLSHLTDAGKLYVMGFGLFIMGLTSALLQTMSNIGSVERAQAWARTELS